MLAGSLELIDRGPHYAETDLSRFPVEPVNTLSNLVFLAVVGVLVWRLTTRRIWTPFFVAVAAILFTGWLGGTIYHATRNSVVWLLMDWVPIAILCLMGAAWFALQVEPRARRKLFYLGLPMLVIALAASGQMSPPMARIGIGYALLATAVVLPAVLYCAQQRGRRAGWLLGAVGAFAVALSCRFADAAFVGEKPALGTHFLWHLFGGLASYLILEYLWREAWEQTRTRKTPA